MVTITNIKMNPHTAGARRWLLLLVLCRIFPLIYCGTTTASSANANSKAKAIATTSPFTADEQAFLEIPSAKTARSSLKFLTMAPHVAGTDGDRKLAEFVLQEFLQAGIPKVSIEDLVVKLNYPNFDSNSSNGSSSSLSLWETTETTLKDEDEESETKSESNKTSTETETVVLGEQHLVRRKKRYTTTPPQNPKPTPMPNNRRKLVFEASLSEDLLDPSIDATTDTKWRNHTFHGYSPSGTISHTKFVYANYGRPQDFKVLHDIGMSVKDKIVLMRYGRCFRGLKVRNAQQRGAIGAILYSDPADDGYSLGDVYPNGPWRPSSGVQRGSVQFNSKCGGDPYRADPRYQTLYNTTVHEICGVADPSKELVPSIPSIPISYGDAIPLLQNLGGAPVAEIPEALANDFIGGLGRSSNCNVSSCVTYHIGPSKGYLDMVVDNVETLATIPNVVGIIPGSLPPHKDQPVLLGNHRDAWVYGAADPNSGTSALLEVARGLGALYTKRGWRPLRSIYLLSWSGEEYGLLGSTGWAELNMAQVEGGNNNSNSNSNKNNNANSIHSSQEDGDETSFSSATASLLQRSLAYLNTDTVVSGDHLNVAASPTLVSVWEQVVSDLKGGDAVAGNDATTWQTTSEASRFLRDVTVVDANSAREIPSSSSSSSGNDDVDDGTNIGVLGSGSDYTVFLDHFGIPSLDFSYSKPRALYGQYHSIYDSFAWMDRFGGTGRRNEDDDENIEGSSFELMAFAAKIWGLLAIRLSDSPIVLLDHVSQGRSLKRYVSYLNDEIANITSASSTPMDPNRNDVQKGTTAKFVFRMENLTEAVELYAKYAARVHLLCSEASISVAKLHATTPHANLTNPSSSTPTPTTPMASAALSERVDTCNEKLGLTERHLLLEDGLPGRRWFKHCLQAPGLDLGYAAESFPGIQQALDENDYPVAQDQIDKAAERIVSAADNLAV